MHRKQSSPLKKLLTAAIALLTTLCVLLSMYIGLVWLNIPGVSELRDLWIETAMTTYEHQWLATAFFPNWLVTRVMAAQEKPPEIVIEIPATSVSTPEPDSDPLGQLNLTEGENDEHGNRVLVNNVEEGIVILRVKGSSFNGHLVLIDDPARVFVGTTNRKGVWGQVICEMMESYGAVVGINASGFEDKEGHGKGGVINGLCYSEGKAWGSYNPQYHSIVLTNSNKLLAGTIPDWDAYDVRDGAQFTPSVIVNGEVVIGRGYGLQPRTIVGQAENGTVMFLVIDGRSTASLGATYLQCADILLTYHCVNAGACDGGSSSVLGYDGKVMNIPSTPMKDTGRYLPNAFLVRSKKG
ncbi:MAG: phosphodiester glycosidase family protein [Clostridia bacterium]|nr:phosphodiester glycosidase family protein [Clostridia bacterium]